ncbi:MAG: class I SAM-dependent methyltransferase, partial [Firmicutes bacterium]|nr:class I SAM-dependent methyltransferase [Bacillota bacterium]
MAHDVCPWWMGYFLLNPLRRFINNPGQTLGRHVSPAMNVMDIGCAMGFFSLPLAKLVGKDGKVVCIDLQERMISTLIKRAKKAGLHDRIEARVCTSNSLGIEDIKEKMDFTLAFAVVHEVDDKKRFFAEIYSAMKPGAKLLI